MDDKKETQPIITIPARKREFRASSEVQNLRHCASNVAKC